MFAKIKYILALIALLVTVLFALNCSPQKRLDRLVKNNPELVKKSDTITEKKNFTVPGFTIDTATAASRNVAELYKVIDSFKGVIDSLTRQELKTEIKNYIINRNCLDQPLTIKFPGGGFFKIYQQGGKFFYHIEQPPKTKTFTVKQVTLMVQPVYRLAWQMFAGGVLFGWLMLALVILLYAHFLKKQNIKTQ